MALDDQCLMDTEQRGEYRKRCRKKINYSTLDTFLNGTILYHLVSKQIGINIQEAQALKRNKMKAIPAYYKEEVKAGPYVNFSSLEKTVIIYVDKKNFI